jgi:CRP-like cAMP-binding protein
VGCHGHHSLRQNADATPSHSGRAPPIGDGSKLTRPRDLPLWEQAVGWSGFKEGVLPLSGDGTKMPRIDQPAAFRNLLLATLPHQTRSALRPHLKLVTLARGAVLSEADDSMRQVCFVERGVVSLVTEHLAAVVVATVGREGAVGGPTLLLGGGSACGRYEMLTSGSALALEATRFNDALQENPSFRKLCEAYSQMFFAQVLQNVTCRKSHSAEQRCASWLLMCEDQIDHETFELAQDSLAAILDVPRVVADAVAARLHCAGLIGLRERLVRITDRRKLKAAACVCYGTWRGHYERLQARACASGSELDPDIRLQCG